MAMTVGFCSRACACQVSVSGPVLDARRLEAVPVLRDDGGKPRPHARESCPVKQPSPPLESISRTRVLHIHTGSANNTCR